MRLIGVDCAVDSRAVGIALAELNGVVDVRDVRAGLRDPWGQVADWLLAPGGAHAVLALDAPLGWPAPLGEGLRNHTAGAPVLTDAHALFRRTTDLFIREMTGKRPLDVGADRIARTAHAALSGLDLLRAMTGLPLPLAWSGDGSGAPRVIEVYPGVTLKAHGAPSQGYKVGKSIEHRRVRQEVLARLPDFRIPADCRTTALGNADALDALVCLLGAADFVRGRARPPENLDLARTEGWIWCRDPS